MKKTTTIAAIVALLTGALASAGQVAGAVSHYRSGKAYPGVNIEVKVGSDRYTARSNANGIYYLVIPDYRMGQTATLYADGVKVQVFTVSNVDKELNIKFK